MEKGMEILQHLERLYNRNYKKDYVSKLAETNPELILSWEKSFQNYDLADVINAIDEYWEYKSSKSRPNVEMLRAILSTKKDVTPVRTYTQEPRVTDYATKFMERDIALGRNHHLKPMYEKAVRCIAEELLSHAIPHEEWKKMDLAARCEKAMKLGLFNEFDDVLVSICRNLNGVDYQF